MIRNGAHLRRTRVEIGRLRERLSTLGAKTVSRRLKGLQAASLDKMLRDLEFQARAYEDARRGRVSPAVLKRLLAPDDPTGRPRIGEAIFLLRVARGLTQAALARRLATRREVVTRWERDDYDAYTLENVIRVFKALGCRLAIHVGVAG
jgi:DNA-binding transcriptional regulator YiaG